MQPEPFRNLDVGDADGERLDPDLPDLPPDALPFSENDIDDGYAAARLGYLFNFLFLPFCLLPWFRRDNAYSLFHAKQALALWMGLVGVGMTGQLLWTVQIGGWIWLVGFPVLWLLNGLGLRQVHEELARPLPLLGLRPQTWFSGEVAEEESSDWDDPS